MYTCNQMDPYGLNLHILVIYPYLLDSLFLDMETPGGLKLTWHRIPSPTKNEWHKQKDATTQSFINSFLCSLLQFITKL